MATWPSQMQSKYFLKIFLKINVTESIGYEQNL